MNKPLDLPDVTLEKFHNIDGFDYLIITHKRTKMETVIPTARLNAWLLRQLRSELVSSKDVK